MIERVRGLSLGGFMDQNIWQPLDIPRPASASPSVPTSVPSKRTCPSLALTAFSTKPASLLPKDTPTDHGGAGGYTSTRDFIKVLATCVHSDPSLPAASAAKAQEMRSSMYAAAEATGSPMAIPAPARFELGARRHADPRIRDRRAASGQFLVGWAAEPQLGG